MTGPKGMALNFFSIFKYEADKFLKTILFLAIHCHIAIR